jgi:hypothetical protein
MKEEKELRGIFLELQELCAAAARRAAVEGTATAVQYSMRLEDPSLFSF